MNPRIWIFPLPSANGLLEAHMRSQRSEQLFSPYDGKLSLKANEPQVGQRHEDVERKRVYYHIIIFPEKTWNCTSRKKRTSENLSNGTLQRHPLPQARTSYQTAYQSINQLLCKIQPTIYGDFCHCT